MESDSKGELILYTAEDGAAAIKLRVADGTVWLTQLELAELFQTTKRNISLHVRNGLAEGELRYRTLLYNLDVILAAGYRVRSPRGTPFRQWATVLLREYLVKGFVLDDARLKEPGRWDYFDELLSASGRFALLRSASTRRCETCTPPQWTTTSRARRPGSSSARCRTRCCGQWPVRPPPSSSPAGRTPRFPIWGCQTWSGSRVRKDDVTVAGPPRRPGRDQP